MYSLEYVIVFFLIFFFHQMSVKTCFIRGSVVRYVHMPKEHVDVQLLQDSARLEAKLQKEGSA
jgi:U6 snRNA-associated Sm-like protein LSm2